MSNSKSETFKNIVEGIAIIVAGIWVVYEFGYKEWYLPTTVPPSLEITSRLQSVGETLLNKKRFTAVKGTIKFHNDSEVELTLLGGYLNLKGYQIKLAEQADFIGEIEKKLNNPKTFINLFNRSIHEKSSKIITSGKLAGPDWILAKNEDFTYEFISYVPHLFQKVELVTSLFFARNSKSVSVHWKVLNNGEILGHLYKDPDEILDPQFNKAHHTLMLDQGIGLNQTKTVLSLP